MPPPPPHNPLAGNAPNFNYRANGYNGGGGGGTREPPKPAFEAPPKARSGFTRDTKAVVEKKAGAGASGASGWVSASASLSNSSGKKKGVAGQQYHQQQQEVEEEEMVVICPSCDKELAYDPDEERPETPASKRPKNRKDREEHHFWAVKECGHVSTGLGHWVKDR